MKNEIVNMVDVITTNKTDFFREPKQFSFLEETALPNLLNNYGAGSRFPLSVWSAGCSTGEEPYTLALVLQEFAHKNQIYDFNILATDISTKVLEKAQTGIYENEKVNPVPLELLKKYFLKSKDKSKGLTRVCKTLRHTVLFQRLNFMDEEYSINSKFDIIFCRNVIIYFDKETQDRLIAKLVNKYLKPGGYLFLGHSESIFNNDLPIIQIAASTYQKLEK